MKNIKSKLLVILCLIISITVSSCKYGTNNFFYAANQVNNRVDYVHYLDDFVKSEDLPDKYRILVLADVHFGSPQKKTETEAFFKWIDKLERDEKFPKFCAILGDNVDHGYEDQYKVYCNFTKEIEKKGIPVITILGNHDLYNSGWQFYQKMCYPYCSVFNFKTKNISWYGIDTGTGDLGQRQYDLLVEAFEKDINPKVIMMHYPLANSKQLGAFSLHDSTERNLLIDLFAKNNVKAALCGHLHQISGANLNVFREYGNPSFCYGEGSPWTLYEIDEKNYSVTELPRKF